MKTPKTNHRWLSSLPALLQERGGMVLFAFLVFLQMLALAGVASALYMNRHRDETRVGITQTQACNLRNAVLFYKEKQGVYPSNREGLKALIRQKIWIAKKVPRDPWDNPYQYRRNKQGGFVVYSLGSDGKEGGTTSTTRDISCPVEE